MKDIIHAIDLKIPGLSIICGDGHVHLRVPSHIPTNTLWMGVASYITPRGAIGYHYVYPKKFVDILKVRGRL